MSIPFHPRALLYTGLVMGGFAAMATAEWPAWLGGGTGAGRDGPVPLGLGGGVAQRDEPREMIEEVLRHESRIHALRPVCARTRSEGAPLDPERRQVEALRGSLRERPDPRAEQQIRAILNRELDWRLPPRSAASGDEDAVRLTAASARPLSLAAAQLAMAPAAPSADVSVDPAWLPVSLRLPEDYCEDRALSFAAPAVMEDLALVETRLSCGEGCRRRSLYALVRSGERWRVGAVAPVAG